MDSAGGLIPAAQDALGKAARAAGVALAAAGIGLAALAVGIVAAVLATVAIVSRVVGEMLSHLAELIHGMIDAVVAMVPALLRGAISVIALGCMWFGFSWAWGGYSQDMPSLLAAILAATIAVVPVAYGYYRRLWPMVAVASATITLVGAALLYLGPIVRVGCIIGALGVLVTRDVMRGRAQSERV